MRKQRTISLPPNVAAELKKWPNENWSAVACRAWRNRVDQLKMNANNNQRIDELFARVRQLFDESFPVLCEHTRRALWACHRQWASDDEIARALVAEAGFGEGP